MFLPSLLTLLALSAGGSAPLSSPLQGTTWVLTQIDPTGHELLTLGKILPQPTLGVRQTRLAGQTGCHTLSGSVYAHAEQWRAIPQLSQSQDCTDHALSLEADFIRLLSTADHYEIGGNRLTLRTQGKVSLIFTAQAVKKAP